jgi:protein SCO1/2
MPAEKPGLGLMPTGLPLLTLLVFILSCQPPAPPEKLVGWGVVQKVVAGDRRVVIAHDDIPGFMRAMTMSFEVSNPALLEQLTPGERVRFTLEKTKETLYLVAIEKEEGEGTPPTSFLPLPPRGSGLG